MRIPRLGHRFRLLLIGYGVGLLFWLSTEDNRTGPVTFLGTGFACLAMAHWLGTRYAGRELPRIWLPVLGALVGIAAILCTAALMFFKSAWHNHIYPDFPPGMIGAMLVRLPAWGVAGGLIGVALSLLSLPKARIIPTVIDPATEN